MKDRIKIDGTWYIKEEQVKSVHSKIPNMEGGEHYTILREDDKYYFELCIDVEGGCPFFIVKYKDFIKDDETWDNDEWIQDLHTNQPKIMPELIDGGFSVGYIRVLQQMLQIAIDKGWWKIKQE